MKDYKEVKTFILYVIIGGTAAVIDYSVFYLVQKSFESLPPEISSFLGQISGFFVSFFLNTYKNFKMTDKLLKRFLSYAGITVVGIIISTVVIAVFKNYIDVFILKIVCLIGVSLLQYFLNRVITYRNK